MNENQEILLPAGDELPLTKKNWRLANLFLETGNIFQRILATLTKLIQEIVHFLPEKNGF